MQKGQKVDLHIITQVSVQEIPNVVGTLGIGVSTR